MGESDAAVRRLLEANPLREPAIRAAIASLDLPRGSRGIDVGCGIGLQAILLAESVGPDGDVTGLDLDPDLLVVGDRLVREAGRSTQVSFRQGDMRALPFPDDSFDWAWSADCVGYPLGELAPVLVELTRVVRPGGSVAILGWSSEQVLPGHQALEAQLNATCSAYLPFLAGKDPERHFLRAPRWFREAGLEAIRSSTFVDDVRDPLRPGERAALTSLFEMLWSGPPPGAAADASAEAAWRDSRRLCTPGSPDFILDAPGYYAFFTYTMFQGTVPGR